MADDWVEELAAAAVPRPGSRPAVVGVAGGVAAGKSTVAEALAGSLRAGGRTVEVLATDAFLLPNAELDRRDLGMRKGFPESYDSALLEAALDRLRAGREAEVPVYSHTTYDRVPDEVRTVGPVDVVVVEGVNALQPPLVDRLDLAVYVDADEDDLRAWFTERFLRLCAAGEGFYAGLAAVPESDQRAVAAAAWDGINGVNLRDHIVPSRERADVIVRKGRDHSVTLRPGLTWEAPGEGDWWLVTDHFPFAVSRLFSSLFPPGTLGWKTGGARYGLPTGEARWASVNGWIYYGPQVPLTPGELAEREPAAKRTLLSTPWRDEVRRWHEDERPRVVAANRALQAEDPAALDDAGLSAHYVRARDNFLAWAPLHFEHTGFDVVAGMLFDAAAGWGLDPAGLTVLLAGASPVSAAVDDHVGAIASALDRARAPAPLASMDDVRAVEDAATALDAYLDDYGWRPLAAHDVLEPTVGERPALVLAAVDARRGRAPATAPPGDPAAAVRARVPEAERDRFDTLLADARASYALRDDDVGVCWNWPLGLVRRAVLEIGARLASRGRIADARHVFEVDHDEVPALLTGGGPDGEELARRWDLRVRAQRADPPPHLAGGGPPPAPVELPASMGRLARIRDAVWSVAPTRVEGPLHGIGVGSETARGTARVVRHPEEMSRLRDGDVLVTVATTTAFNAVFPLLAGVVTEQGGLFSHCAILAREVGLPAVVGVPDVFAPDGVHDGDLVELDPASGTVRVIERAG